jgi:hypothetical protein
MEELPARLEIPYRELDAQSSLTRLCLRRLLLREAALMWKPGGGEVCSPKTPLLGNSVNRGKEKGRFEI